MPEHIILFYDGECSFCNKTVQWVLKRNSKETVYFAPLQGSTANELLLTHNQFSQHVDSVILYKNNHIYMYSDAVLQLAKELDGIWKFMTIFSVVPPIIRNFIYKGFAKRRYKWFGQATSCQIPSPHQRSKFLN